MNRLRGIEALRAFAVAMAAGFFASTSIEAGAADVISPSYSPMSSRSEIEFNLPAPIPNAYHQFSDYLFTLASPRATAIGDFNGDGFLDIVVAPTYFSFGPKLPIQIWINQGDGTFAEETSGVIEGPIPVVGSANNIFVADFNGDGRADIFIVDQGLEDKNSDNPGQDGEKNHVLLSQPNGKLADTTDSSLPG